MNDLSLAFVRHLGANVGLIQWNNLNPDSAEDHSATFDHPSTAPAANMTHPLSPDLEDLPPYSNYHAAAAAAASTSTASDNFGYYGSNYNTSDGHWDNTINTTAADGLDVPWWYTMTFIVMFAILICCSFVIREACYRWLGWECCANLTPSHSRHPLAYRSRSDRVSPGQQAIRASAEIQQEQLDKQRQERRLWYLYYLRPYTTVLTAANFLEDEKNDEAINGTLPNTLEMEEEQDQPADSPNSTAAVVDPPTNCQEGNGDDSHSCSRTSLGENQQQPQAEDDEKDSVLCDVPLTDDPGNDGTGNSASSDEENPPSPSSSTTATAKDDCAHEITTTADPTTVVADGDPSSGTPTKMMTVWDPHYNCYNRVEANCIICFGDYEVGDVIVRSAPGSEEEYCNHVFHYECMLQWLSQGKKRCPMCRHWFVPATRIKEQMKQAHVVTNPGSLHHLYNVDTMEGVASIVETESNISGSLNSGEGGGGNTNNDPPAIISDENNNATTDPATTTTIQESTTSENHHPHHHHSSHDHHRRSRSYPNDPPRTLQLSRRSGSGTVEIDLELGYPGFHY